MARAREHQPVKTLSDLLNDAEYSDLTIKCQDRVFHVHKAIVCRASPTLKAAIQHGTKETISSTIEHTEFDAETVERMISYIYTADYRVSGSDSEADTAVATSESKKRKLTMLIPSSNSPTASNAASQAMTGINTNPRSTKSNGSVNRSLMAHARVFGLGDYYNIPDLKTLAREKFVQTGARDDWSVEAFIDVVKVVD